MEIRTYAGDQASVLLRKLAFQVKRATKLPDPEAVHDLRVAIRRLSQCLRVFRRLFPGGEAKKIRRRLQQVLSLGAEVRDRDIALQFAKEAGLSARAALVVRLTAERRQAEHELSAALRQLARRDFSRRWRKRLSL